MFVPHVTEVYKGPISAADPEGVPHPLCTLRYFPSTVEHILQVNLSCPTHLNPKMAHLFFIQHLIVPLPPQWARDEFEGLFSRSAETINCYQE